MRILTLLSLVVVPVGARSNDFVVHHLEGSPVSGELRTLLPDGTIHFANGSQVRAGQWYVVRRDSVALPPLAKAPHIEFVNGDRLVGTISSGDGDALKISVAKSDQGKLELRFPLSSIRTVWRVSRNGIAPAWIDDVRQRDVIQSRNGDVTMGALTRIDVEKNLLQYQGSGKDQQVEWKQVAVIGFNTDLARFRRPKGHYYRLTLADGSRLSVSSVRFDGTDWSIQTLFKEVWKLPAAQVLSVDVEQGKATYLSDLRPSRYEYQSSDGETHPWIADRSAAGLPIRLKGKGGESTFVRGVGLHAECTIVYTLSKNFRRLEFIAGLDAQTGLRGNAVLSIRLDGAERELPNGGRLTAAGDPVAVRLDVSGVNELLIAVRRGNGGIVQDHVNLAEARLLP